MYSNSENELDPEVEPPAEIQQEEEMPEEENEWKDKYYRMAADFDNLRKRSARQLAVAGDLALQQFVTTLLPAKDALERGLEMAHTVASHDPETFKTGLETTLALMDSAFQNADIETIDPKGKAFDPELHEAISVRQVPIAEPGLVLEVLEKGYRIKDQLIRAAKVVVAAD
jgi:molecular chaperone GrpE